MMENGFSSPRNDAFPAGLRVLVVDDDPTWLKILEKMLKKCSYEVTTCGLARDALNLLRERKGGFDIVLSDVNMPDMDGFILLELVGLEMDLPVIMMSVDGETRRVMKGVQHGACDYLLKPIRMKELRNIWQHVLRKKIHEVRDIDNYESIEDIQMFRNGSDQIDEGHLLSRDDSTPILVRKRKDVEDNHGDKEFGDPSSTKKARVFWTIDLHQKFVRAVNQIGIDKIGPKKILDLMNVPWLTRENVASHLQKYRLYLSRLPKENDLMFSSNGAMHSDLSPKDPTGNFGFQNSLNVVQSDASSSNYGFSGNKIRIQNADPTIHECDLRGVFQSSRTEPKKPLTVDVPIYQKDGRRRMGQNHSCESPVADENYATFNFTIPTQNFWSGEVSEIQLKQEHKTHFQLKDGFNHLPEFGLQQNILHDRLKPSPSINVYPSITERDKMGPVEINPLYANYRSNHIKDLALAGSANNWFSKVPISTATLSTKTHGFNQNCVNDTESSRRNVISDSGSAVASLGKDLQLHWLQGDYCNTNIELQKIDFLDYNEPDLITDVPLFLYDALRFDYDYPCDSVEYPIFDQRPLHEPFSFAASGNQTSSVKLGI